MIRNLLRIAIPALGVVVADPVMSLVDTACVGQVSSIELAAMGPNSSVFGMIFMMFGFLGTATTNIMAQNDMFTKGLSTEASEARARRGSRAQSDALFLAIFFGVLCTLILSFMGPTVLQWAGATDETLGPALAYLRIRAVACPAVLLLFVLEGSFIGQQDAMSPLKFILLATLINLLGDAVLVLGFKQGIIGAAIATAAAQFIAAGTLFWDLYRQGIQGHKVKIKWHGIPKLRDLAAFQAVARAMVSRNVLIMTKYVVMTRVVTTLGVVELAAHQVGLSLFWLMCTFLEPLSLAAQTMVARAADASPDVVLRIIRIIMLVTSFLSVILGGLTAVMFTSLPFLFTRDATVMMHITGLWAPALAALSIYGAMMLGDTISVAANEMEHIPRLNFVGMTIACGYLLYAEVRNN